jgi:hypothetical protein
VAEFVDLRLKFGEAELDVRGLLLHSFTLEMIHKKGAAPRFFSSRSIWIQIP